MTSTGQMEDIGASIAKLTEAVDNLNPSQDEGVEDMLSQIRDAIENTIPILALMALTPYAAANPEAQKTCETLMIYVGSQAEEQGWFKRIQQVRQRVSNIIDNAISESNAKVEKSVAT